MPCVYPLKLQHGDFQVLVGCGRCRSCLVRKKQSWVGRLLLERKDHIWARFITLTYSDDPGVLNPEDFQNFMKRYRHHYGQCRFFAVGEYGDKYGRGHWHAVIFGHRNEFNGHWHNNPAWSAGYSFDVGCTEKSIRYVAGYTLKKMGVPATHKPIALMSRKPGIGMDRVAELARSCARIGKIAGWPTGYQIQGKWYPLMDSALEHFKTIFLQSGGLVDRIQTPDEADRLARFGMSLGDQIEAGRKALTLTHRDNVSQHGTQAKR